MTKSLILILIIGCPERVIDSSRIETNSIITEFEDALNKEHDAEFKAEYKNSNVEMVHDYLKIIDSKHLREETNV